MPDYQKAKIYKLYSVSNEELVYYGSTIETLSARLSKHVYDYNNNNSIESSLVIGAGDYKIELVENYPCVNKQQLVKKESEYIRNNICVNRNIPDRTKKEYYQDNKEKLTEQKKQYYENNKEALAEKKKEYREKNKETIAEQKKEKITCECGCIVRKDGLVRHKKSNKHLELIQ